VVELVIKLCGIFADHPLEAHGIVYATPLTHLNQLIAARVVDFRVIIIIPGVIQGLLLLECLAL
jgi:hypothetical protein